MRHQISTTVKQPLLLSTGCFSDISDDTDSYILSHIITSLFLFSYFWGWLSDNIGRKPVLLTSLCLTMATNVLFGFSATFAMAVGTRFINGLVNGKILRIMEWRGNWSITSRSDRDFFLKKIKIAARHGAAGPFLMTHGINVLVVLLKAHSKFTWFICNALKCELNSLAYCRVGN